MIQKLSRSKFAERRGELMAELLLQDLGAKFISRPTLDVGYDLLAGFENEKGGTNTFVIEVRSTERPPGKRYPFTRRTFNRIACSNIPGLLLVADVKRSQLYFAWLSSKNSNGSGNSVSVPLIELNQTTIKQLKRQLEEVERGVAAAG